MFEGRCVPQCSVQAPAQCCCQGEGEQRPLAGSHQHAQQVVRWGEVSTRGENLRHRWPSQRYQARSSRRHMLARANRETLRISSYFFSRSHAFEPFCMMFTGPRTGPQQAVPCSVHHDHAPALERRHRLCMHSLPQARTTRSVRDVSGTRLCAGTSIQCTSARGGTASTTAPAESRADDVMAMLGQHFMVPWLTTEGSLMFFCNLSGASRLLHPSSGTCSPGHKTSHQVRQPQVPGAAC